VFDRVLDQRHQQHRRELGVVQRRFDGDRTARPRAHAQLEQVQVRTHQLDLVVQSAAALRTWGRAVRR
jgi:hypothetical protein